jgi:hypothetical protein
MKSLSWKRKQRGEDSMSELSRSTIAGPVADPLANEKRGTQLLLENEQRRSPGGRRLAYGGYGATENAGLWVLDLASGKAKRVLSGPFTMPVWSADGKRVAFYFRPRVGPSEVWVVDATTVDPFAPE